MPRSRKQSQAPNQSLSQLLRLCLLLLFTVLVCTTQAQAKTGSASTSTATSTSTRHRHARVAASTAQAQVSHGRRHHVASQHEASSQIATATSARRRRGHRQETVAHTSSKNSSHQKLTRKTHERTIEHKNSDEETHQVSEEDKEPPPVHVDFEGIMRAYTLYDAGVNHRLIGNFPLSLSELREAQQIFHLHSQQQSPMESYAYFELAKTAEEAGSYDLAVHSYQACSDLDPKFTEARLNLARLEAKHGNIQAALRDAKAACSQDPGSPEARLIVSLLMQKSGLKPDLPTENAPRTDIELGKDLSKDSDLIRKIPDVDETQPSTMDPTMDPKEP